MRIPRSFHHPPSPPPPTRLYRTLADIRRWPEWDGGLEWTRIEVPAAAGAAFTLKPRGGPEVPMQVEAAEAPHRFVDIARLPLARMRTVHEFGTGDGETLVTVAIEVFGPLAFLWDRLVARKQAQDAPDQTQWLIAFAETQP